MLTWVKHQDKYLDEFLRLEGRGDKSVYSTCGGCSERDPLFRCEHQACFGCGMFCQRCIVLRHQVLPTHWVQVCFSSWHLETVTDARLGMGWNIFQTPQPERSRTRHPTRPSGGM